jgi:hypothetical protein
VQATDWFVGQVIDRLQAIGEYDKSLVVVTADHGVTFPYSRAATAKNYPNLMWTPLFVKAPDQSEGRIDDRAMRSVDVLPTMADILGVKLPWKVDGITARRSPRAEGRRPVIGGLAERTGTEKSYDGAAGFASVLESVAAPPGGDPGLRLYRVGKYGALTGQPAEPLVQAAPPWLTGRMTTPRRWEHVVPDGRAAPWAIAHGRVRRVTPGRTVAIAVNGRIAGLARVDRKGQYDAPLSPELFVAGTNTVTPYLVRGTPHAPRLLPISDARARPSSK